jgi:hypothetical protein
MDTSNDKNKTSDIKKYHKEIRLQNLDKYKERDLKRYWIKKLLKKQIDINSIQTDNLTINETIELYKALLIKHKLIEINPKIMERLNN